MTERSWNVEPPFARRPVQWTLAGIVSLLLLWIGWNWPPSATRPPDTNWGDDTKRVDDLEISLELDLNVAQARELALIPGVGPVLAGRIVSDRERRGDFQSLADLQRVHGIGPQTLRQIARICVVGSPSQGNHSAARPVGSAGPSATAVAAD